MTRESKNGREDAEKRKARAAIPVEEAPRWATAKDFGPIAQAAEGGGQSPGEPWDGQPGEGGDDEAVPVGTTEKLAKALAESEEARRNAKSKVKWAGEFGP